MMSSTEDIDHQNVKSGSSSNMSTTTVVTASSSHPHDLSSDRTTTEQLQLQPVPQPPPPPPPNFLDTFPMGYRFNPTNKEVLDYLNLRVEKKELPPNKFNEINLYDHHPEYLTSERFKDYENKEWYFFTPRDRKYRNGSRPKRAAGNGFWKAIGVDKVICDNDKNEKLGRKKSLVFHEGKPPKGTKTCWVMHEFKLEKSTIRKNSRPDMRLDDWVLCRIHMKKEINKSTDSTTTTSSGSRKRSRSVHDHSLSSNGEDDDHPQDGPNMLGNLQQDLHQPEEQQEEEDALSAGVADVYNDEDVHKLYGSRMHQHYHPTEDHTILNNNSSLIMGTAVSSSTTVVRGAVVPPLQTCPPSTSSWITVPVGHNDYYLQYACGTVGPDMVSVSAIHNSHNNYNIQQVYDQNHQIQRRRQWDYSNHMLMNSSSSSVPAGGRPALLIPRPQQQVFHVPVHCGPPSQMQQIQQQDYHQQYYSYGADCISSSSRNKVVVHDHAIRAAAEYCRERHMVFKENDNNTNINEQHPDYYYAGVNQECFETPYSMILNDRYE